MMDHGTTLQAVTLAKARWAQIWPFDLADETWLQLFAEHRPGDVLEAIRKTRQTRDRKSEKVYRGLLFWIDTLERNHAEKNNLSWPPPDITPY
jgi:hypothetical protein